MSIDMTALKKRRHYLYAAFLGLFLILAAIPFELEMAPERHIQIMDSEGHLLPDAIVKQIWYQYSLGERGEVDFQAGNTGEVDLQKRVIRTSIYSLLTGAVKEIRDVGIHASFFSDETIIILAHGYPPHIYFAGKGLSGGKAVIRKGPLNRTIIGSEN